MSWPSLARSILFWEKSTGSAMLMNLIHFVISIWVPLVCAVIIVAVLPLVAGYIVLMERKVMADMQARLGPMRVGPHGLLQPIADAVKLLIKEDIIPYEADKAIFWFAPLISVTAAMLAMSALAIGPWFQIAELNVGLLFIVGISALGIFGIVLGGWASNSHYSLLGALRSAAQLVSYETAAGVGIVGGLLLAGTLSAREIIQAQDDYGTWFAFAAPVGFFIYIVASIAETNRAPFDLPEAESELVAGYMTEYSGFRWALYFLAEYANMIVVASVGTTLLLVAVAAYCVFRAGKQPARVQSLLMWAVAFACFVVAIIFALTGPFGHPRLRFMHDGLYGAFWFLLKVSAYIYLFMWLRFTLPRFRFDQLMRLGWHILIPLALVNVVGVGVALALTSEFGLNRWLAMVFTTLATLGIAMLLLRWNDKYSAAASAALLADSPIAEDSHAG